MPAARDHHGPPLLSVSADRYFNPKPSARSASVSLSQPTFSVSEGRIVYALGALKNVGVEAMRTLVAARGDRPFRDLTDFARRVPLRQVGKRALEMLARAGAFDELDANRARVLKSLDALVAWSTAVQDAARSSQGVSSGPVQTSSPAS